MVSQLTVAERQRAMIILLAVAVIGLVMTVAGRDDPIGIHGMLVTAASVGMIFVVIAGYFAPEPSEDRLAHYYDDPSKVGIILAMIWVVFALSVGVRVAWQLYFPSLTFDAGWSGLGRIRPVHTTGVIFGFGGMR